SCAVLDFAQSGRLWERAGARQRGAWSGSRLFVRRWPSIGRSRQWPAATEWGCSGYEAGPFGRTEFACDQRFAACQFFGSQHVVVEAVLLAEGGDHARDDVFARQAGLAAQ